MMNSQIFKFALLMGTLFALLQFAPALMSDAADPSYWVLAAGYLVSFFAFYFYDALIQSQKQEEQEDNPHLAHIEALYKQAMIVVKNANKTNSVFQRQLSYVQHLIEKCRHLQPGDDFERLQEELTHELAVLEKHVEHIMVEMQKNVRLGEKLQQTIANLDPEIGVLD